MKSSMRTDGQFDIAKWCKNLDKMARSAYITEFEQLTGKKFDDLDSNMKKLMFSKTTAPRIALCNEHIKLMRWIKGEVCPLCKK